MDVIVVSWVLGMLSSKLMESADHGTTRHGLTSMITIEAQSLYNREARVLCLDADFRVFLQNLSIDDYHHNMRPL